MSNDGRVVGVYEMWWDCEYCGTTKLLGKTNRHCPNCGAAQNAEKRYLPPKGEEQAVNTTFDGSDVRCPACATPNGAKAHNCRQCGSPLDGSAEVKKVATRDNASPGAPAPAAAVPSKPKRWPWVVGGVAVLLLGTCVVGALWKKEVTATVRGHAWSRSIDIEALQAVNESSWCDGMPADAYAVSKSREQRSTKKVPDGETCTTKDVDRGDGTFERREVCKPKYRDEPVYDQKCRYTVDRWRKSRAAVAQGDALSPEPQWPGFTLGRTGHCLGCEREGPHHERYVVKLEDQERKTHDCEKPQAVWQRFAVGATRPLKVRVMTGAADCDSLQP